MKNPEPIKHEGWEEKFDKKFVNTDYAKESLHSHWMVDPIKDFIRNLLKGREEEHKKEIEKLKELHAHDFVKYARLQEEDIKKLKQQHKSQLEGLKKIINTENRGDIITNPVYVISELNKAIDKLLK